MVAEYYLQFTSLANRVYGLSNDALIDCFISGLNVNALIDCFISGLNVDIHRDILIHTPTSIVSLTKVYEEKYTPITKKKTQPLILPTNPSSIKQIITRKIW
ncbi:hypothetical protein KIW84_033764, partial [Lathyrus oleraceus]